MVVGNRRPCPECNSVVDIAEIICPVCGHVIPPPPKNPAPSKAAIDVVSPRWTRRRIMPGIIAGNVAGLIQTLFGQWAFHHSHGVGNAYITANFFVVPFLVGLIGSFFWRTLRPTAQSLAGYSLSSAIMVLIVWLVLTVLLPGQLGSLPLVFGGAVIFVAPLVTLVFFVVWLGSLVGNRLFRLPELRE